ncbi:glyoxylate reductase [Planctomycetaceae bacterium]|nr:glyoxylate reductase [Planctomycetaceae bacterium]
MHKILITRSIPAPALELLRRELPGVTLELHEADSVMTRDELLAHGRDTDALICTLADTIDASILAAFSRLRVIANYAVGTNNIALDAANQRGIAVTNTPIVLTDATAETAIGLMLACARRFIEGDVLTRQGRFTGWAPLFHLGHGLYGKTVGIFGAGRIGARVARTMARGFDCPILYHNRKANPEFERETGARLCPLDELLRQSDFVSLHCPLTPQTKHLIDSRALSLMKPTAYLINTARGQVVDEHALIAALKAGTIAGAGLDVYENEPALAPGLAELDNVVLLPHIGSATVETRQTMGLMCAQSVIDVLHGREPKNRVV